VSVVVLGPEPLPAELRAALAGTAHRPTLAILDAPNRAAQSGRGPIAQVAEGLARARALYVDASFDACLTELPSHDARLALVTMGERELVARADVMRVACEFARGHVVEARLAAAAFAIQGLPLPAELGELSPECEHIVTSGLRAADASGRVRHTLRSAPNGASVSVDGRSRGCLTPCTLELAPGEHVAAFEAPGRRPRSLYFTAGDALSETTAALEAAGPDLAAEQWTKLHRGGADLDRDGSVALLGTALATRDLVLLVAELRGDDSLSVRGSFARDGVVRARLAASSLARPVRQSALAGLIDGLLMEGNLLPKPRPIYKSPWLWGSVLVVAAASATTAFLLARPRPVRTEVGF
jgi:hypothetical protein